MSLSRFVPGALLLAAPLLGHAQSPASRFYVGLAAYHSNYQNLASWRQGDTGFRVPVQLTVGYQLRPRLALELGVAYRGHTNTYAYDYSYTTGSGILTNFHTSGTTTERIASVSALARYTLTRQPTNRLQVDVLGGGTLLHGNFYSHGVRSDDFSGSLETTTFASRNVANDLLLTAGLGLRYRLCSRFELNFDVATNYNLTEPTAYTDGFTGSSALGLRYRFGQ